MSSRLEEYIKVWRHTGWRGGKNGAETSQLWSSSWFGGWSLGKKITEDFKMLMQVIADKKKEELEAQTGAENRITMTVQLASYISQNRQQLSKVCVQAQSRQVGGSGRSNRRPGGERGQSGWSRIGRKRDKQGKVQPGRDGGLGEQGISSCEILKVI